jgi:N-acetylglucosamine repressor
MEYNPLRTTELRKRNSVLHAIHRRSTESRLQLAKALGISNSRVCNLVDEMVTEGLLVEESAVAQRRGRRGVGVRLNSSYGHLLGFDMEARRLRAVVTDFSGQVVWQRRHDLHKPRNGDILLQQILDFLDQVVLEIQPLYPKILGIGLAASGVLDVDRGLILHYDMLPQVANLPLRDRVSQHLNLPCVMLNNIRAMTLAEWTTGAARGLRSFVLLAVRSGVGAGIVLDGKLLPGSHGLCGEIGYMVLPIGHDPAKWKHLQQAVSEVALGIDVEADDAHRIPPHVTQAAGELIGSQLASIAALIDPQAIILAGGVLHPDGPVWPHALSTFKRLAIPELADQLPILPAHLGPFAAATGAAHRCLYELFPV